METIDRKKHWENIYNSKDLKEVSWYQARPETSLDFFHQLKIPKTAKIIDIGGGDSLLVDHLIMEGYTDVTVLDISNKALEKAKRRLGDAAKRINWIAADVTEFNPPTKYDVWHDRAAFHFLTEEKEIERYLEIARTSINPSGVLVLGTFSQNGPEKCSGIKIKQYSESSMTSFLQKYFEKIKCTTIDHLTPAGKIQNFVFCSFRRDGGSNVTSK